MNQKKRDAFPYIYELMHKLYEYDADLEVWQKLYAELNKLEPDYTQIAKNQVEKSMYGKYCNFDDYVAGVKDLNHEIDIFFEMWDKAVSRHSKYYPVNYTGEVRKPWNAPFIKALGVLLTLYFSGLAMEYIKLAFERWEKDELENYGINK